MVWSTLEYLFCEVKIDDMLFLATEVLPPAILAFEFCHLPIQLMFILESRGLRSTGEKYQKPALVH